ncbi:MAG: 4-hydroxy-tetrahydrodipicolinate synthase [Pseudomonadota bacterium]
MLADRLKGSIPALVTPFKDGKVDEKGLIDLVNWQIDEGSHGLVAVGTTGESPTLSHEEHREVIRIIVETAAGRVPVLAGAGSNNTVESVGLMQFAEEVGADGALVVTPYYNKPNQRGLYEHYKALHEAADLPIVIYNIPGRSVIDMSVETMAKLAELPRIIGVKDATADMMRCSETKAACGDGFVLLTGEDGSALGFAAHGGVGCISVTANTAPRLCAEFQAALLAGDFPKALEYQAKLLPLHRAIFREPSPAPTKYAMSLIGRGTGELRLPMVEVSDDTKAQVRAAMIHAGLLN